MGIFHSRVCGGHDDDERALMARIAYTPREPVVIDKRRTMTRARKERIHAMRGGLCWGCGLPVDIHGPGVVYDHRNPLTIKGSDADSEIWPLHKACDSEKTNRRDKPRIAKTKRQAKMSLDVPRRAPRMKSGKTKWPKRKMSRPIPQENQQ